MTSKAVSRAARASHFCFGKSGQNHCAGHAGFGNVVLPQLPCDARRSRAGANSAVPGLGHARLARAIGCASRRHATTRFLLRWRPSVALFGASPGRSLRAHTRAGSAAIGAPRTRRADDGGARRVAHRRCASSPRAQGCAVGEPRRPGANPQHRDVRRTCSRGGLLFGDFLLATQEKVTRAPGRGAEKDMDVATRSARHRAP